jgi:hypothetical protein
MEARKEDEEHELPSAQGELEVQPELADQMRESISIEPKGHDFNEIRVEAV